MNCDFVRDGESFVCTQCGGSLPILRNRDIVPKRNCKPRTPRVAKIVHALTVPGRQTRRISKFLLALTKFVILGGGKFLPDEKIMTRFALCRTCDQFTGKGCKVCGCRCNSRRKLMNKLALPTERCPATPPRWEVEP